MNPLLRPNSFNVRKKKEKRKSKNQKHQTAILLPLFNAGAVFFCVGVGLDLGVSLSPGGGPSLLAILSAASTSRSFEDLFFFGALCSQLCRPPTPVQSPSPSCKLGGSSPACCDSWQSRRQGRRQGEGRRKRGALSCSSADVASHRYRLHRSRWQSRRLTRRRKERRRRTRRPQSRLAAR
jgi:hypothetical protein